MRFWIAALSMAALLFSSEAALADKRVAFVVGNGAYVNVPQLPNPPMDAKLMASTLRNVGFDVGPPNLFGPLMHFPFGR